MKILNVATDPLRAEPPGIEGADRERGPDRSNQPARHIEVRPGAWDDARDTFDWFEDGEMVHLWVEEGLPDYPIWPAPFHLATGGLSFQRWRCGDVMNMLTFDRDGQAVLSTHAPGGDPPRTVASVATGTCAIVDGQ